MHPSESCWNICAWWWWVREENNTNLQTGEECRLDCLGVVDNLAKEERGGLIPTTCLLCLTWKTEALKWQLTAGPNISRHRVATLRWEGEQDAQ